MKLTHTDPHWEGCPELIGAKLVLADGRELIVSRIDTRLTPFEGAVSTLTFEESP